MSDVVYGLCCLQGRSAPSKIIFEMGTFPMSDVNSETTFVCQPRWAATKKWSQICYWSPGRSRSSYRKWLGFWGKRDFRLKRALFRQEISRKFRQIRPKFRENFAKFLRNFALLVIFVWISIIFVQISWKISRNFVKIVLLSENDPKFREISFFLKGANFAKNFAKFTLGPSGIVAPWGEHWVLLNKNVFRGTRTSF